MNVLALSIAGPPQSVWLRPKQISHANSLDFVRLGLAEAVGQPGRMENGHADGLEEGRTGRPAGELTAERAGSGDSDQRSFQRAVDGRTLKVAGS
jgi:hypothetical protein